MFNRLQNAFVILPLIGVACATAQSQELSEQRVRATIARAETVEPEEVDETLTTEPEGVDEEPHAAAEPQPAEEPKVVKPDPKDIQRAKRIMVRGMRAYRKGDYDGAEVLLKEAITIYPFLPKANLALGKILLIRGSATRDIALIESARLMFEMARALDPSLREADMLLELFQQAPE